MDECIKLIIENNNRNTRDNLVLMWYINCNNNFLS